MRVKEIQRTANIAWSPASHHPVYLAAGTAAQQLDATFSTSAALEIFALDLQSGDKEMPVKGTLSSEHRFHKLVWGTFGMDKEEIPSGVLVGGTDNGSVMVWDPAKILSGETDDALIVQTDKHTGAVQALDLNPFQANLLASGASDSEIYVWDLNNPDSPLTPGAKSLPPDNISCLSWNRQVQHILASTSPCGRCVVWDLRKNEPIIKVSDQGSMVRCKAIEWHPEVATQMVLASEDDRCPVIQMWDLRYATSPMKVLEKHQRGVLSIAWCPQDPELLMSCGKDSRILCWNPSSNDPRGEVVYELPCPAQWSFDVQWCPRNPNLICTPSFDGHISIYSLMGGTAVEHGTVDQKSVNDAFNISDPFTASIQHQTSSHVPAVGATLKKPPKWLRRPCGATFGFGGKLISFGKTENTSASQVTISQVVTEADLVNRSNLLEGALASGSFAEFCRTKIESCSAELDSTLWSFLKVNFEGEPRKQFLTLLGYDPINFAKKVAAKIGEAGPGGDQGTFDASKLAEKLGQLSVPTSSDGDSGAVFSGGASTPSVADPSITPLSESTDATSVFDAIASGTLDTSGSEGSGIKITTPFGIPTDDDGDGLISQALLTGNFEAAVDVCIQSDRMADAFLLAIAGGPDLLARTQEMYFQKNKTNLKRLMSVVVNRDWPDVVKSCKLENWREALAILVTYAKPEEFAPLCDLLGQRLEGQKDDHYANAMVCYICAGNVEKFVSCWSKTMPSEPSPLELQNLIEKVMILKKAVEKERRQVVKATNSHVSEMLCKYASILASQGSVEIAMEYLMSANDQESVNVLRDRLYYAQYPSHVTSSITPPTFPFSRIDVKSEPVAQPQAPQPTSSYADSQRQTAAQPGQVSQPGGFYNPSGGYQSQVPSNTMPVQPHLNQPSFYQGQQQQPTHIPPAMGNFPSQVNQPYTGNMPPMPQPAPVVNNPVNPPSPRQFNNPPPPLPGTSQFTNPGGVPPPPMPGYGMTNTPGAPTSYPPPPGGGGQPDPHHQPSAWSADGTHVIAKKHQPSNYTPPAPITMPIFDLQQTGPAGNQGNQNPTVPQGAGVPPGAPPQGPAQTTAATNQQPEPVKEVMKGPIPAEHISLQEAFDGLVTKCRGTAINQQTKKKLDDVTRKLEALYDKLREQKLSQSILDGLHHIAQACQNTDYASGYQAYTSLISSGSFSEISSFMPGIKSLMQIATQLRV